MGYMYSFVFKRLKLVNYGIQFKEINKVNQAKSSKRNLMWMKEKTNKLVER